MDSLQQQHTEFEAILRATAPKLVMIDSLVWAASSASSASAAAGGGVVVRGETICGEQAHQTNCASVVERTFRALLSGWYAIGQFLPEVSKLA